MYLYSVCQYFSFWQANHSTILHRNQIVFFIFRYQASLSCHTMIYREENIANHKKKKKSSQFNSFFLAEKQCVLWEKILVIDLRKKREEQRGREDGRISWSVCELMVGSNRRRRRRKKKQKKPSPGLPMDYHTRVSLSFPLLSFSFLSSPLLSYLTLTAWNSTGVPPPPVSLRYQGLA